MLAGILTSILGSVIKNLITELIGGFFGYLDRQTQDAAQREAGRLEAERNQVTEGLKLQQELSAIAARPLAQDDVLARLAKGDA